MPVPKVIRTLEPGTTLQVNEARDKRLRVALPLADQPLEGWVEAKDLLVLDPGTPYHRALEYQGSHDVQQAIEAYTEAIEADKKNARAYYNRALLFRERDDAARVIADCTEAIKIDGKFAEAYLTRGNAYASQDDFQSAINDYDEAIKIRLKYTLAYYNRSLVRHRWASKLATIPAKQKEAAELERHAIEDLAAAKTLGLPALIAKRLENAGKPTDIVSAAEAGYIKILAKGGQGTSGLGLHLSSLIPFGFAADVRGPSGNAFCRPGTTPKHGYVRRRSVYPRQELGWRL